MTLQQLPLPLCLPDNQTFNYFYTGPNAEIIMTLQKAARNETNTLVYCWGENGSGRSHLLAASCMEAKNEKRRAIYIPCAQYDLFAPQVFEDLEQFDVICLDDIDKITLQPAWAEALFHLYNRVTMTKANLIVTAKQPPLLLECCLADLRSRLSAMLVLNLHPLHDEDKYQVLMLHAKARGLALSTEATEFLLNHWLRDLTALLQALQKLDEAALIAKKKITIPFIKQVLGM